MLHQDGGHAMAGKRGSVRLRLERLEARDLPSTITATETFDATSLGNLPPGWTQWSSDGSSAFAVESGQAVSNPNGLAISASTSRLIARAWQTALGPANVQVSSNVLLSSLIPVQILARGSNLGSASPSFYALAITRGLEIDLLRTVNGTTTTLATLKSANWFSYQWVGLTLSVNGTMLQASVVRLDNGQYLNSSGQWQTNPAWALTVNDTSSLALASAVGGRSPLTGGPVTTVSPLSSGGLVGLGRPSSYAGSAIVDDFAVTTASASAQNESFDTTSPGSLPANWAQASSDGSKVFAVAASQALSAPNNLTATALTSRVAAQAWLQTPQAADLQVTSAVYLNSVIPAQVLARGSGLGTATPSFYAVAVSRGLEVDLLCTVKGVTTTLATLHSVSWFSDQWVRVTLGVSGTTLQAQVFRIDTAQYLNGAGQWQAAPAWALTATDSNLAAGGLVGVGRPSSYVGTLIFDDFGVAPPGGIKQAPTVTILKPASGATLSGPAMVTATASALDAIAHVDYFVDGVLRATANTAPYPWTFDTTTTSNGAHTLMAKAYDLAENVGQASITVVTNNSSALPRPIIPQHLPNIRILELDYASALGSAETQLLQTGVDAVVASGSLSNQIQAVAPSTPQLTYTNLTNTYGPLLTSWLAYVNANGLNPESAFYHVAQATPFGGTSPSSQPVNWFWAVSLTGVGSAQDLTSRASGIQPGGVAFGGVGQAVNIAYPQPFNLINVSLSTPAASSWSAVVEYPSAVDAGGNPTTWSALPINSDTTSGLHQSGQLTFDPPSNWKMATLNGSAPMYYLRYRTLTAGTAPIAATILGDDYVGANGGSSGVIPAFDSSADLNHDGYLTDAEYAARKTGMSARFLYQSRAFYASYGQMRFATNPSDPGFRAWAVQYEVNLLSTQPYSSGLFVDNSGGNLAVNAVALVESTASYTSDYGTLLNAIGQAIAPRWILANTAGGGTAANAVVQNVAAYYEEFALRPLASNYQQFAALASVVAQRAALTTPSPFAVLDSDPTGGSPTDPRTQIATLASYYLLADPTTTFLDFYGGYAPATSWSQHWSQAAAYKIGQPLGAWSLFASGSDPENASLTYQVYQRPYTNALVLYKPLSASANGAVSGTLDNATATTFTLSGTYRPLNADGTLGAAVTSIALRNGEGAILIKA
jgi:hypothetical protein